MPNDPYDLAMPPHGQGTFDAQNDAIRRGRELAEQEQGELVVHGKDGEVREKDSHGHDPRNIPG